MRWHSDKDNSFKVNTCVAFSALTHNVLQSLPPSGSKIFFISPKRKPHGNKQFLPSPWPQPPGNHRSAFCLWQIPPILNSLIYVEPYHTWFRSSSHLALTFLSIMYIIHNVAYISSSLLFVAEQYSVIRIDPVLFIHSSIRHLGCFHPFGYCE